MTDITLNNQHVPGRPDVLERNRKESQHVAQTPTNQKSSFNTIQDSVAVRSGAGRVDGDVRQLPEHNIDEDVAQDLASNSRILLSNAQVTIAPYDNAVIRDLLQTAS